jgi:DNA repair protein RadA/Sms
MVEEARKSESKSRHWNETSSAESPVLLAAVDASHARRYIVGISEFDRVLGSGVVPGSLILVGGDPGIGKSTLLLQAAFRLALSQRVLYISGEESATQVKLRADRLGPTPANLYLLCETRVDAILQAVHQLKPAIAIVDSIQTLVHPEIASVPGSVSQVRECGGAMMNLAKSANGPAIFLVGHVTKEGLLAGPRVLEHMVDTVLYFEGDRQHGFRILRTVKNRFGSTNEVGIFEMQAEGLVEVGNPSRLFLSERQPGGSGSAVAVSLEGTRPLLIEIQALVSTSYFGMPQRRVSGLDYNRTCLILAVLERRAGLQLGSQDVFASVAGGLAVDEPAVDLALAAAIVSSLKDQPVDAQTAIIGEVGLGGEIRAVSQSERRVWEAAQLGFTRCLLPARSLEEIKKKPDMQFIGIHTLQEALNVLMKT